MNNNLINIINKLKRNTFQFNSKHKFAYTHLVYSRFELQKLNVYSTGTEYSQCRWQSEDPSSYRVFPLSCARARECTRPPEQLKRYLLTKIILRTNYYFSYMICTKPDLVVTEHSSFLSHRSFFHS